MRLSALSALLCVANAVLVASFNDSATHGSGGHGGKPNGKITPKVFIIDLYDEEGESWYGIRDFNLLAHNVTVPGLSPFFPSVHCTSDYSICQLIAGEGEINAATSVTSLAFSPLFDLRKTYFLITGVAGINPRVASTASVTFSRFAVQVDLQYEFDPRDLSRNFSTGYIPQGSTSATQYPQEIYGTEVFELNAALRDAAMSLVKSANVTLADSPAAQQYRARFLHGPASTLPGARPPSLVACDSATADTYFAGSILNAAFDNYTRLVTNGSGVYCAAQQEDNAVLEPLLRANAAGNRTDFSRVLLVRTASDFVAPPPGVSAFDNLIYGQDGYAPALKNIRIAGVPIVQGIVRNWDRVYGPGIKAKNYVGDILGTLGGGPDFGPGPAMEPDVLVPMGGERKRSDEAEGVGSSPVLKGRLAQRRRGKRRAGDLLPRMRITLNF